MLGVLLVTAMLGGAEPPKVLFSEKFTGPAPGGVPAGWEFWTPTPRMKLATAAQPGSFRMAGNGNPHAKGRLWRKLDGFQTGHWYRFEVRFTASGIRNPNNALLMLVEMAGSQNTRLLTIEKRDGEQFQAGLILQMPEIAKGSAMLHLFAGFIPQGWVQWKQVAVSEVPGYAPPRRPIRVAIVDGQPAGSGSAAESARHYASEIDRACEGKKTDVVLLPENFNKSNVKNVQPASMDSEYMRIIREAARRNNTYLAGSLFEDVDGQAFNSAFLIDRRGQVAGTYHKSHLTTGEMMFSPLSRSEDVRVFKADFGMVGIAVCFDFHYPEFARMLALKGAELVLVPMAADDRLKEEGFARSAEYSGKSFVLENRIPIAFAATLAKDIQPSLIIDQFCKVLARSNSKQHIIAAELDLAGVATRWSGDAFHSIHKVGRRPEMYGDLMK
jgi:predicted amidohydrolase